MRAGGPSGRLRDAPFKISYGPGDDRLHAFYIPALSRSVRYDRSAGFFSSTALAVAAAGVAHLIRNGGRMRLLVGAALEERDVEAIRRGHELAGRLTPRLLEALQDPEDLLVRRRLEALAWMVAEGTLEIRVVLPVGPDGRPLSAAIARDYYHPKEGVFTDLDGDQVAFSGSVNESAQAWVDNYEQFAVYRSWDASRPYLLQVVHRFERLWEGKEPSWIALPIPEAVREGLLRFRPDRPPERDPLERYEAEDMRRLPLEEERERLLFQFVRDAPSLPNAHRLGMATAACTPWPHQRRVVETIVERFPAWVLLGDEVGLGKTVEAGLALRQLVLSGRVRRCLILVPKSLVSQWQEELYEKFLLNVPVYDGHRFLDVFGRELPARTDNPWDAYPLLLASSQLAKRKDRQPELKASASWDLLIVDEAHHARRKAFLSDRYRPNRLLELLTALKERTKGMLLLTATPMQVHPVEVWDLLRLLGLSGQWSLEEHFLRFFQELRKPFDEADWDFLLTMLRDAFEAGVEIDQAFAREAERQLGPVEWQEIRNLPFTERRQAILKQLSPRGRAFLVEFLRRHTPLRLLAFRTTRPLLREYQRLGLLNERVPQRDPKPVWIPMRPEERELYERVEEYISDFYEKYEAERKGLGFVMTVYRRRLTSSFAALEQSLERRLRFLRGESTDGGILGLDDDDLEQEDLALDITEELQGVDRRLFREEMAYIEDFLTALRHLPGDSKFEQLVQELGEVFRQRETALVFTQYTDTLDFLRERLRQVYGRQVACYSGRGGERWDGFGWLKVSKEEIKNAFRDGEVKLLLCTEAASEGLNLQTCGVLINYDMPWNPMRVEQRIGRIDRIGQRYDLVWIRHYFYEETVEAEVYRRLSDRIGWFEAIVGELQPILTRVADTIQRVALTRRAERGRRLEEELAALQADLEARQAEALQLEEYVDTAVHEPAEEPVPVTLQDLEALLVSSRALGRHFTPHPERPGAYLLRWQGREVAVTFDPALFDRYPDTLRLLSFGEKLLEELLTAVSPPRPAHPGAVARCAVETPDPLCAYYACRSDGIHPLETLSALKQALDQPASSRDSEESLRTQVQAVLAPVIEVRRRQLEGIEARRRKATALSLAAEAQQLLLQAALIELALEERPELFEEPTALDFSEAAILRLARHGYPFAGLLRLVEIQGFRPSPADPFFLQVQGASPSILHQRFEVLKQRAAKVLQELAALKRTARMKADTEGHSQPLPVTFFFPHSQESFPSPGQGKASMESS